MMIIKEDLLQWFTSFFDKKSSGSGVDTDPNYQLANELHRQIIRKFNRKFKFGKFGELRFGNLEVK